MSKGAAPPPREPDTGASRYYRWPQASHGRMTYVARVPWPLLPANELSTVPRPMQRPRAAATRAHFLVILGLALGLASPGLAGCDQLSARSMVQEGNGLYEDQEYEKAIAKYEGALKKTPSLGVIHHNLGLSYARLFRPGLDTPANKAIADKASEHLSAWLESHPGDTKVRKYLLNLWIEAGQYQRALDYYQAEHAKDPRNSELIGKVAQIYLAMTDWRTSIEWLYKDAELAADPAAKIAAYNRIANVAFGQLWSSRTKVVGTLRTEIAEVGIQAAGQGLAVVEGGATDLRLADKNILNTSISNGLWSQHAIAQGQYWAATIDRAEGQIFEQRARVLRDEAKKNQPPPAAPGKPPGSGS